jgi:hypothetical protein
MVLVGLFLERSITYRYAGHVRTVDGGGRFLSLMQNCLGGGWTSANYAAFGLCWFFHNATAVA